MAWNRRQTLGAIMGGSLLPVSAARSAAPCVTDEATDPAQWAEGFEGQRRADLGDGTFLNPILSGDRPDPTILKDGADYYMTFSSFNAYPGVVIWHSRDLVNWSPIGPALRTSIGTVWAMDLIKHDGRYFIYIPAFSGDRQSVYVIWADDMRGPWSEPIDLNLDGCIDPGHAVGEDGKRYLFVNGIRRIRLKDDGLATDGPLEMAYDPWRYPDDWVVEMFAPEGPKLLQEGDYFYLVTAVGGTSGPPTSHMVIAARSRSIHGPWEHCPHNPITRTVCASEKWWSRGHATVVEGPSGDWWMVYHGYENGFRTLGRQCLLEPIEWTEDGWFRALGGDLSMPLAIPQGGHKGPAGYPMSDDFSTDKFGLQWNFHNPQDHEMQRARIDNGALYLAGKGTAPLDTSPICFVVGDLSYEIQVTLTIPAATEGGMLLYYSERMFVGLGFTDSEMRTFNNGIEQSWMREKIDASTIHIRITNDRNIVTMYYSADGTAWIKHPWQMEVSGIHHNVFGGFLSLRPALYACGEREVRMSDFRYRALRD